MSRVKFLLDFGEDGIKSFEVDKMGKNIIAATCSEK
jgi:hypothetical protein